MKIHYLYHSGFFIEQEHHYLLFDYYQGTLPLLDKEKPLYIFISHAHYDHYNPAVLSLASYYPKCRIIAADLHEEGFLEVRPDERYIVDDIEIQTLTPPGEGVAFLIKSEESYFIMPVTCIYGTGKKIQNSSAGKCMNVIETKWKS